MNLSLRNNFKVGGSNKENIIIIFDISGLIHEFYVIYHKCPDKYKKKSANEAERVCVFLYSIYLFIFKF